VKLSVAFGGIQRLCIETAPFIYFVERNATYIERVREIFKMLDDGVFEGVTSTITLTEVLMKPIQAGDIVLQRAYRELLLNTRNIEVEPISILIAEKAAELRAVHNLRTPDALQVATAIISGCQGFLTNDRKLLRVTDVPVFVLDDLELDTPTSKA
jgi:predicted nucleic acid-binding protein